MADGPGQGRPRDWRLEVYGNDALALKHGKLALTARNKRIEVVPL